jgi:hypothetical protein
MVRANALPGIWNACPVRGATSMLIRTVRPLLAALAVVSLATAAFAGTAQARDTTLSPWYEGSEPNWLIPAMNAAVVESHVLVKHWSNTNTAFWDVFGVPVYIGTRRQLDAMGQKKFEREMWANCDEGIHRYTPANSLSGPHPSAYPDTIVILTAGPAKCLEHGKWSAKDHQTTLIHEVLEMLVDPQNVPHHYRRVNGRIAEVCDWVGGYSRYDQADGAWIPDFVYPSFFKHGSFPYDYFGKRTNPLPTGAPSRDFF